MPTAEYYRNRAEVFLKLTLGSRDPVVAARFNVLMLECLAKAEQLEPSPHQIGRVAMVACLAPALSSSLPGFFQHNVSGRSIRPAGRPSARSPGDLCRAPVRKRQT